MNPAAPPLGIGGLPGPDRLQDLARRGCRRLVALNGVDLAELYGRPAVAGFRREVFAFPDVFSAGAPWAGSAPADPGRYLGASSPAERRQFLAAVLATSEALRRGEPVFVFCDLGLGRSPLVALAALLRAGNKSLADGLDYVRRLQPRARFTDISLSALAWTRAAAKGAA